MITTRAPRRSGAVLDRKIGEFIDERLPSDSSGSDRFALDPCALADEGHVWVLDLRSLQPSLLALWPHQREIIQTWVDVEHLRNTGRLAFRNVHEEKSRQMGVTWATSYLLYWALAYHGVPMLAISRKLGEICDPGYTTDSVFGRIRYIWSRVPDDLRPPLVFSGGNDPVIRNPRTGGFLAGEGAVLDPGRGGKYAGIFLDEAARIPWGRTVHAAVSRACPEGRLYNSTPQGEDDLYYWLRHTRPPGYTFLRHHWSVHPWYGEGAHIAGSQPDTCAMCAGNRDEIPWEPHNPRAHRYPGRLASPWYDAAITELTDEQVSEELDIDYAGSLPARVYGEFNHDVHVVEHVDLDPNLPMRLAWDYGWDCTSIVICQQSPTELRVVGEYETSDSIPSEVADGLRAVLRRLGVPDKELQNFNTLTWTCWGDPSGDAHSLSTGRPLTADYRAAGWNIQSIRRPVDQTILSVKRLLLGQPARLYVSGDTAPGFVRHLANNRWPVDRAGNRKLSATAPLDDQHNHAARAFAYLITALYPPPDVLASLRDVDPDLEWEDGRLDPDLPRYGEML